MRASGNVNGLGRTVLASVTATKRCSGPLFERSFLVALARAFAGAIIFALPLIMTMEMWALGFYMDPLRLALFLALMFPLLAVLAYYAGFEESVSWRHLILNACVAYAVAFVAAAAGLALLGVLRPGMSIEEIVGKVSLQAIPASIGAMLARSQLGEREEQKDEERRRDTYHGELFLATVGALFLAFNVAPTEEVVLISTMMTGWHALALVGMSLAIMHAFVYAVEFRGQASVHPELSVWSEFLRLTVVAYALALLVCLYVLWSFGRSDGLALGELLMQTVVLGFPAAIGAAAARLIL
jgi:putative integral membrane protein (TIGR02587 family)